MRGGGGWMDQMVLGRGGRVMEFASELLRLRVWHSKHELARRQTLRSPLKCRNFFSTTLWEMTDDVLIGTEPKKEKHYVRSLNTTST
ncbi:hypothetical protein ZEAMMB73_Zm00001d005311 [Zea mays]|uniref:Uncharacterized protein n=1 Tax=Zea mays TaxID=4577 RepID=A0A1D6ELR5_MAIZE|nr:hypothetical protein ZEAMMB73_Zm00001d005311 [Zea mays]